MSPVTNEAPQGTQPSLLSGGSLPDGLGLRNQWPSITELSLPKRAASGDNVTGKALPKALRRFETGGISCRSRTAERLTGFVDGLKPVEPGADPARH